MRPIAARGLRSISGATIIAVVGAECTGKSTLVQALGARLRRDGRDVALVPEALRSFCERHGRTPFASEQAQIALAQTGAIACAAASHELVIADTTALVTAAYSNLVFDDNSLDSGALADHRCCVLTLLCGLDLPWVADGHQRSGADSRAPLDAWLRLAMEGAGQAYSVLYGQGDVRMQRALAAIDRIENQPGTHRGVWRWSCRHCSDVA